MTQKFSREAARVALAVIGALTGTAVIIVLIAAALWSPAAHAAGNIKHHTGMPLMEGVKTPTDLAALVERSLKADKTGRRILDRKLCKATGSCSTARDYFIGIKMVHPDAHLGTIAELPRYLRSLVRQPPPKGEWQMSRLLVKGDSHRYDATGWHRAFLKGEAAWYDVNTGEPVLAGACGNVVGKRYAPPHVAVTTPPKPCATVEYAVKQGDLVRFAVLTYGKDRLPDACWQLCDGDECSAPPSPCQDCDWIGPLSVIPSGYLPNYTGLYIAHGAKQTLRFPREVKANYVALCVTRGDLGESDSWVVQPSAWGTATTVVVPYGGQEWPSWERVDMSRWRK